MLAPFECLCGNFILPEPASYVFFYAVFILRNLLYLIKEKFGDTLLNKNYYELLRIFPNELEKENALLVANGFSFRDEHILDLVKRSMVNPSLKILIFVYNESTIGDLQRLFGTPKNNNITYIALDGEKLSLNYFNQILSYIHS